MDEGELLLYAEWMAGPANGDYFQIGACLPTRDGRVTGNATVTAIDHNKAYIVVTAFVIERIVRGRWGHWNVRRLSSGLLKIVDEGRDTVK